MNPEIKEKWIEALLSGEFKQGEGTLCRNNFYCCLGVLCEVAIREGLPLKKKIYDISNSHTSYGKEENPACLPNEVVVWSGISTRWGAFMDESEISMDLSTLNDKGTSFKEISKIIEKHF